MSIDLIHTSMNILCELLEDRGYDSEKAKTDFDEVPLATVATAISPPVYFSIASEVTVVYCIQKDTIKHARDTILVHLKKYGAKDNDGEAEPTDIDMQGSSHHFIIVLQDKISSNMASILEDYDKCMNTLGGSITWFTLRELQFNPSKHHLVPKHIKLSDDEIKVVLQTYRLKNRFHLPIISHTDVMARYLGLRHGDVVKINRLNQSSGEYFYYRCCL